MNLNKLLRSNINGMTPYSSARDEYKDLDADYGVFGCQRKSV